jgi:hypothetical protein
VVAGGGSPRSGGFDARARPGVTARRAAWALRVGAIAGLLLLVGLVNCVRAGTPGREDPPPYAGIGSR